MENKSSVSKLERGLIVVSNSQQLNKCATNNSPAKAQFTVPKDQRFRWQIKTTSSLISYQNHYAESSFIKKPSSGSTTFGGSKREWFTPKKTPCPAQYDIGSTFKRSNSTQAIQIPADGPGPRNMSMYKSQNLKQRKPGPTSYNTQNFTDLGSISRQPKYTIRKA